MLSRRTTSSRTSESTGKWERFVTPLLTVLVLSLVQLLPMGAAEAANPKGPPQRIGVFRLNFRGSIPAEIRRQFLQRVIDGLTAAEFQVFPVVGEELANCTTAVCFAEGAHRLRVDYLVAGAVEEHAKTYAVTLRLIDGRHGEEMGSHHDTCETCGAEEAAEKIALAASALRSRLNSVGEQPSRFIVRSRPAGAELNVDGKALGVTPVDLELSAGEHQLRLSAHGFEPIERTFNAIAGIDETLSLEMLSRPSSFPLATMGYASLAAGVASLAAGAWALHVNERQVACGASMADVNGHCPRQWHTTNAAVLLIGAGTALCTLGGAWLYLSRSVGGRDDAPPATGTGTAGPVPTAANTAYFVGIAGRL